ncbi:BAG family molecular chaperone regulator 8, chloroplastic [Lotus japonicus]|uniref:BAG family molecular chaperone regulator 8, chloroplastic n=1 Tax=Lotus japonicus TaxID=34305 RepID=UPI00258CCB29|nr:BAG family molecular chaperone regulator 8, chloroplastic [Lotus japonicus]
MASHHHHHHPPYPHHHQPSPPPPPSHCCCNPSYSNCCTTTPPPHHPSPPPPPHDHLVQAIASLLLSQPHLIPTQLHPKPHTRDNLDLNTHHLKHQHQTHSTISSLLDRIESLESSLNLHTHQSLRHAAARVIQTHFRSFLVRRSRTLSYLKHLASIKSSFNALKSSFSSKPHFDFSALSFKAMNLLLELDSIQDCDPMILDGKRSISRDLVQFLDSIEEVAMKKHLHCVKAVKNPRYGRKVQKPKNVGDEEKRKLLQNLRGRVERISKLCNNPSANGEDLEPDEGIYDHEDEDEDGVTNVLMSRRSEVSANKNGGFVQRQGVVQPRVKKSVRFAENGNTYEVYNSSTCEPDLNGDVTCSEGSSSGDDQVEVLENVSCAVEDVLDSSQGAENDDSVGSPHSSDDGEKLSRKGLRNGGRIIVKEQVQGHQEQLLFSAPLPLKMENRTDSKKSKGVKILT